MRAVVVTGFDPSVRMGGAEYQSFLIAQGLVEAGHEVFFLATDAGTQKTYDREGVTVKTLPGWRETSKEAHKAQVTDVLREINPEICYIRAFDAFETVIPVCKELNIPSISMTCHGMEATPIMVGYNLKEAVWYLRSRRTFQHLRSFRQIRNATLHVAISNSLREQVQRWLPNKTVRTIYNGVPVPEPIPPHEPSGQVIWVNNLKRWKRPDKFIELAARLPNYKFMMIGRMAEGRYGQKIQAMMDNATPNFEYLGPQPIDEVNRLIAESDLLLYTSLPVEGFGNSFVQAWLRGVPTVSLNFDVDGIPERENIGRCSLDFETLVKDVDELMQNDELRQDMGRRAREYAARNHSAQRLVNDYESLFQEIIANA